MSQATETMLLQRILAPVSRCLTPEVARQLVALQAAELDFKRRQQLVYEAQKLFHDDVGYVVLFYTDVLEAHRTDTITGWKDVPGGVAGNWTDAGHLALRPA